MEVVEKIEEYLFKPVNYVADLVGNFISKLWNDQRVEIGIEVGLLCIYALTCKGIGKAITGIYSCTDPGFFTSILFMLRDKQFDSIFGLDALLTAGVLLFLQDTYIQVCKEKGCKGVKLYGKNILFAATISAFLSFIVSGGRILASWIGPLAIIFKVIAIFFVIVSLWQTIKNIGLMFKTFIVGLATEYALLAVIMLILLLITLLIVLVSYILPSATALQLLSRAHEVTSNTLTYLKAGQLPDWYETTVANLVMFFGYAVLIVHDRNKIKKVKEQTKKDIHKNCEIENENLVEIKENTDSIKDDGFWYNKWKAFFLCLFLGYFGAHKFYEHKYAVGVFYIFTLGLYGFGWIGDTIYLLTRPNPYFVANKKKVR